MTASLTSAPRAHSAQLVSTPFSKFLQYRRYLLQVERQGQPERLEVPVLNGPGHDVAAVASCVLGPNGQPCMLLKTGDTRLSRVLRGDDYVKLGSVAGRLDKLGADFTKIGLAELTEEVGGEVVNQSLRRLGSLSPTMPCESSECDAAFVALVRLSGRPTGDGGGMELPGLIGPVFLEPEEGWQRCNRGQVSDAGRCQMAFARAFDAMGYVRELGLFVQDQPALQARFDTLGLGEPVDPRTQTSPSPLLADAGPDGSPESQVNTGMFVRCQELEVGDGATMLDGISVHASAGTAVGAPFANQLLRLPYDRAKVIEYATTPQGPLVRLRLQERPCLAVRALALASECCEPAAASAWLRRDVEDVRLERGRPALEQLRERFGPGCRQLGAPTTASAGQCDLQYFYMAVERPAEAEFVPLSSALRACREDHGDAQTEAALLRLAEYLQWIPSLNLSLAEARGLLR